MVSTQQLLNKQTNKQTNNNVRERHQGHVRLKTNQVRFIGKIWCNSFGVDQQNNCLCFTWSLRVWRFAYYLSSLKSQVTTLGNLGCSPFGLNPTNQVKQNESGLFRFSPNKNAQHPNTKVTKTSFFEIEPYLYTGRRYRPPLSESYPNPARHQSSLSSLWDSTEVVRDLGSFRRSSFTKEKDR